MSRSFIIKKKLFTECVLMELLCQICEALNSSLYIISLNSLINVIINDINSFKSVSVK